MSFGGTFRIVPKEEEPANNPLGKYLKYSYVGFEFFLAVALGTGAGIWLDGRFGTGVIFTLVGLAIGFGGGFIALYREVFPEKPPSKARNGQAEGQNSKKS